MSKKPDYSTWLSKQQAAELLEVSTKTVARFVDEGKIQQRQWHRPGVGPGRRVVVLHPDDVERLRQQRIPDADPIAVPDLLPAVTAKIVPARTMLPGSFQDVQQARISWRLFLTFPQAAEFTGLGVGYLRRLVDSGTLSPLKGAGPRGASVFRRVDLEKL